MVLVFYDDELFSELRSLRHLTSIQQIKIESLEQKLSTHEFYSHSKINSLECKLKLEKINQKVHNLCKFSELYSTAVINIHKDKVEELSTELQSSMELSEKLSGLLEKKEEEVLMYKRKFKAAKGEWKVFKTLLEEFDSHLSVPNYEGLSEQQHCGTLRDVVKRLKFEITKLRSVSYSKVKDDGLENDLNDEIIMTRAKAEFFRRRINLLFTVPQSSISEKDAEVDLLSTESQPSIFEKDAGIDLLLTESLTSIAEKDAEIDLLSTQSLSSVAEKDAEIDQITKTQAEVANLKMSNQLTESQSSIAEKNAEMDLQLTESHSSVAEKDAETDLLLTDSHSSVSEKDAEIDQIARTQAEHANLKMNNLLTESQSSIAEKDAEIDSAEKNKEVCKNSEEVSIDSRELELLRELSDSATPSLHHCIVEPGNSTLQGENHGLTETNVTLRKDLHHSDPCVKGCRSLKRKSSETTLNVHGLSSDGTLFSESTSEGSPLAKKRATGVTLASQTPSSPRCSQEIAAEITDGVTLASETPKPLRRSKRIAAKTAAGVNSALQGPSSDGTLFSKTTSEGSPLAKKRATGVTLDSQTPSSPRCSLEIAAEVAFGVTLASETPKSLRHSKRIAAKTAAGVTSALQAPTLPTRTKRKAVEPASSSQLKVPKLR